MLPSCSIYWMRHRILGFAHICRTVLLVFSSIHLYAYHLFFLYHFNPPLNLISFFTPSFIRVRMYRVFPRTSFPVRSQHWIKSASKYFNLLVCLQKPWPTFWRPETTLRSGCKTLDTFTTYRTCMKWSRWKLTVSKLSSRDYDQSLCGRTSTTFSRTDATYVRSWYKK